MSIGLIFIIILVIFLLGGFSGRLGRYGYGFGHGGIAVIEVVLDHLGRSASDGAALISRARISR